MSAAKEEVLHILESLPEDASLDDIQCHIYVRQKIDRLLPIVGVVGDVRTHTLEAAPRPTIYTSYRTAAARHLAI